jgi:hypothetical protein
MKEIILYALIFGCFRFFEVLINKGIEKSKVTPNTWDDALFAALKLILSIFKKGKKQ